MGSQAPQKCTPDGHDFGAIFGTNSAVVTVPDSDTRASAEPNTKLVKLTPWGCRCGRRIAGVIGEIGEIPHRYISH